MLVLIDLANAFKCVSPGMDDAMGGHVLPPRLQSAGRKLSDSRGSTGGTARPSLFALAVHPCIIEATRVAESQHPGDLDFKAFFSDDGVIAGKAQAVQLFLATFELLVREIGLEVARNKTEVALACSAVQNFTLHDFEGCTWVPDNNIKFLGAAIGTQESCESLLVWRVTKARILLEAIGRYHDSQGAFALLRSCTGWAKILPLLLSPPPQPTHPPTAPSREPWQG